MRILVTGATGFIGSYFIKWLLKEDGQVSIVGFDRKSDGRNESRLEDSVDNPWFKMVWGDLNNPKDISGLCESIDWVINFAAFTFVDHSIKDDEPFVQSNLLGARSLMQEAMRSKVKRFLQVSTDEVYGQILEGKYSEDAPLNPRNPYASTKAAADMLAISYFHTFNFPVIITRTENNFGPFQHPQKALPVFTRKALSGEKLPIYGDGQHVRCWLYVEDHCRAIWHLLEHGQLGEIYHVAGEQELTNVDLAKLVLKTLDGSEDQIEFIDDHNIRPGHDRRYALAVDKIKATGWEPKYTLEERMAYTIKWYASNPWWSL